MLSRARMCAPHSGHAEPGSTIDSLRGTRWITTVRKEPNTSPRPANATTRITDNAPLAYPPTSWRAPALAVRDLADVRRLCAVAEQVESGDQDRRVVHGALVRDVHRPPDELGRGASRVVVPEVDVALRV